eukprot:gene11688-biopygen9830
MAKAYWVSAYRAVKDADKLAAYAKLAGPAITAGGGRFLARGLPAKVYEYGLAQRTVLVEFDSVEQATATHDSPEYQAQVLHGRARGSLAQIVENRAQDDLARAFIAGDGQAHVVRAVVDLRVQLGHRCVGRHPLHTHMRRIAVSLPETFVDARARNAGGKQPRMQPD